MFIIIKEEDDTIEEQKYLTHTSRHCKNKNLR